MYHRNRILFYIFLIVAFPTLASSTVESEPAAVLSPQYTNEILELAALVEDSAYDAAFEKGQALLVRVRHEFSDSYDEAKILDFIVNAYYRSSRVMDPEALAMSEKAIQIKEALLGANSPELANSLMHRGNLFTRRWESQKSIPFFDRALIILEVAGSDFDNQQAIILNSKGVAYRRMARNLEALEFYGQALAIQEKVLGKNHPDLAATLNNQAVVLTERGDYSTAAKLHRRAMAIRENHFGPDHEWVAESAHNLANQLSYLGKYDEALALGERSIEIFERQLGTDHQRYWWAQENLGITYLDMGDHAKALPLLEKALDGLTRRYGAKNANLCYALDALANCRYEMGEYELALETYSESLRMGNAAYGKGSYETADTIGQQGKCLIALGQFEEALERLELSLTIWTANLDSENAMLCDLHNRLAELHLLRGEFDHALEHATKSSMLSLRDLGENHPQLAASSLLEGRAHYHLRNYDAALSLALKAEEISRNHLQQTMGVLSEDLALEYADSRVNGLNLAMSILIRGESAPRVAEVWDAVIRSRSIVLDQYTARNRFLSDRDDSLTASLQDSSLVLRERLANLTLRGTGWEEVPVYHQLLTETETDLQAIERQLSLHSASFRHWQKDQQKGFAQVARALPDDSALVAFTRYREQLGPEKYLVFILRDSDEDPVVRNLGEVRFIDAAVADWRDQVTFGVRQVNPQQPALEDETASRGFLKIPKSTEDQLKSYNEAGVLVRQLVWDPVSARIRRTGSTFIVPDGSLHLLSFPSLPTGIDKFLVEEHGLMHLLTAEKTLVMDDTVPVQSGKLLALGGPDYGTVPNPDGMIFSPLPQTLAEVERIATIWLDQGGQTTLLSGPEASEENLKKNLAGIQILHLATHGFFHTGPKISGQSSKWDNPLIRSGLALAGANNWLEGANGGRDGLLTAEEVSALDLTDMQWAVLSACDTGLGELATRGEGVFGLRRVFALAGARTVIMSLWSVNDESSRQWMCALYQARWQDGMSTAEAMRQASLQILAQRRAANQSVHPYYWAGFVAAGDWH